MGLILNEDLHIYINKIIKVMQMKLLVSVSLCKLLISCA